MYSKPYHTPWIKHIVQQNIIAQNKVMQRWFKSEVAKVVINF